MSDNEHKSAIRLAGAHKWRDPYEELHKICMNMTEGDSLRVSGGDFPVEHGFCGRSESQLRYLIVNNFSRYFDCTLDEDGQFIATRNNYSGYQRSFEGGISFGILTRDALSEVAERTIAAILKLKVPVEIVVVCDQVFEVPDSVRIERFDNAPGRFLLNQKKKALLDVMRYENVCLLHDHILLDDFFFENLFSFGNNFDFYDTIRATRNGEEAQTSQMTFRRGLLGYARQFSVVRSRSVDDEYFINGAFIFGKRQLFDVLGWPTHLGWGELEDVHFSRLIFLKGYYVRVDRANRVLSHGQRVVTASKLNKIKRYLKSVFHRLSM